MRLTFLWISLLIEVLVFWWAGPSAPEGATIFQQLILKSQSAAAWTAAGFASLTLTLIAVQLSLIPYTHGRRFAGAHGDGAGQPLVYETGLHWLVLLRDIRVGRLNDGHEALLSKPLDERSEGRSYAWRSIWLPIRIAAIVSLFFIGWLGWVLRNFPDDLAQWSAQVSRHLTQSVPDGMAIPRDGLISALTFAPGALTTFKSFAQSNVLGAFLGLVGLWFLLAALARMTKGIPGVTLALRLSRWLVVILALLTIFVSNSFAWLDPVYNFLPGLGLSNGIVAVGYLALNLTIVELPLYLLYWTSWRYAITQDPKSKDSHLVIVGGVFNHARRDVQLERIDNTIINQKFLERILDVGDVGIVQVGGKDAEFIHNVQGPIALVNAIKRAITERRRSAHAD